MVEQGPQRISFIAEAWVNFHLNEDRSLKKEENRWAEALVSNLAYDDADQCLRIVRHVVELNQSTEILSNLGAGPIEEMLVQHPTFVIEKIESLAKGCPAFRDALGAAWLDDVPEPVAKRVLAVCRTPG